MRENNQNLFRIALIKTTNLPVFYCKYILDLIIGFGMKLYLKLSGVKGFY